MRLRGDGKKGVWGTPSAAWVRSRRRWRARRAAWRRDRNECRCARNDRRGDRAVGVILDNGETVRAKYIASGVNPKLLYTRLVPSGRWRRSSSSASAAGATAPAPRMNVALSACLVHGAAGDGDHLTAGIILAPSLDYMDRAWQTPAPRLEPRAGGRALDPSTLDDSLCPPGQHVASLFCQHVAPQLPMDAPGTTIATSRRSHDRDGG